jgi:hypothetical protein
MPRVYNIELWFYKAEYGTWKDKIISLWSRGKYSHVEYYNPLTKKCGSSSARDGGVRWKKIIPSSAWDRIQFCIPKASNEEIVKRINALVHKLYDWKGIAFAQAINAKIHDRDKWFCSELIFSILKSVGVRSDLYPCEVNPVRILEVLKRRFAWQFAPTPVLQYL